MKIRQGDVFWVDMDKVFPDLPHYQKGIRPCLVISNNKNNRYCDLVTVIPLTTQSDYLPIHMYIFVNCVKNYCLPEQITCIHKSLLREKYGHICDGYMKKVKDALLIQFSKEGYYETDERPAEAGGEKS